jgi:hypothetical protein
MGVARGKAVDSAGCSLEGAVCQAVLAVPRHRPATGVRQGITVGVRSHCRSSAAVVGGGSQAVGCVLRVPSSGNCTAGGVAFGQAVAHRIEAVAARVAAHPRCRLLHKFVSGVISVAGRAAVAWHGWDGGADRQHVADRIVLDIAELRQERAVHARRAVGQVGDDAPNVMGVGGGQVAAGVLARQPGKVYQNPDDCLYVFGGISGICSSVDTCWAAAVARLRETE